MAAWSIRIETSSFPIGTARAGSQNSPGAESEGWNIDRQYGKQWLQIRETAASRGCGANGQYSRCQTRGDGFLSSLARTRLQIVPGENPLFSSQRNLIGQGSVQAGQHARV